MPRPTGTTQAQLDFLRAFYTAPAGPAPAEWPAPAVLKKWLARPTFRKSLVGLFEALHVRADLQLAAAATHVAANLSATTPDAPALQPRDALRLLRQAHLRERAHAKDQTTQKALKGRELAVAFESTMAFFEELQERFDADVNDELFHLRSIRNFDDIVRRRAKALGFTPPPAPPTATPPERPASTHAIVQPH
ncbi:MAG TPA: hypothetical protein VK986_12965 [Tepidisphaeraceae bacterium]|nr:hypothetical protein [Tepidisphaeraceae bacterium]